MTKGLIRVRLAPFEGDRGCCCVWLIRKFGGSVAYSEADLETYEDAQLTVRLMYNINKIKT